jgi:flagellar biosynthetic protein FliR
MSLEYLLTWMMVFLRSIGVILLFPALTGRPLPIMARLGICVCLATLLAGVVPLATVPTGHWDLVVAAAGEVALGLTLGFVARMAFAAVEMGGRIISSEIGLSATPGLGAPDPATEPIAAMLTALAVVLFFLFGAHQVVLGAFARSFTISLAGQPAFDPSTVDALIRATADVLELGLRIAAPFIAMNFLVNLSFSVLGRAVPKMNVFIVSYSARALVGLALLSVAGTLIARYLFVEFGGIALQMLQVLPRP